MNINFTLRDMKTQWFLFFKNIFFLLIDRLNLIAQNVVTLKIATIYNNVKARK